MTYTLNITGYSPQQMGNDTLYNVAFPFHKEANWYNKSFDEYDELDYYAKMYNMLENKDLESFWRNLQACFEEVWLRSTWI